MKMHRSYKVISVFSAKGGVGKTTSSICIAKNLEKLGYKVGIMDLDFTSPSLFSIFSFENKKIKNISENKKKYFEFDKIHPISIENIKVFSVGFFSSASSPNIWRGLFQNKAINQFWDKINWGDIDFLILDMPPGISDIMLYVNQKISPDAFIAVTNQSFQSIEQTGMSIEAIKQRDKIIGVIYNMIIGDSFCFDKHNFLLKRNAFIVFNSGMLSYEYKLLADKKFINFFACVSDWIINFCNKNSPLI